MKIGSVTCEFVLKMDYTSVMETHGSYAFNFKLV